jgi:hypothetical protein
MFGEILYKRIGVWSWVYGDTKYSKGLGLDFMSYIFLVEQTASVAEMSPYCGVFCVPRVQLRQSGFWVK